MKTIICFQLAFVYESFSLSWTNLQQFYHSDSTWFFSIILQDVLSELFIATWTTSMFFFEQFYKLIWLLLSLTSLLWFHEKLTWTSLVNNKSCKAFLINFFYFQKLIILKLPILQIRYSDSKLGDINTIKSYLILVLLPKFQTLSLTLQIHFPANQLNVILRVN